MTDNIFREATRTTCQHTTPALNRVWQLSRTHRDTCFLVRCSDLPPELAHRTTENRCLVVAAKMQWDLDAASACCDMTIRCAELALVSDDSSLPNELRAVLAFDNNKLLLDFSGLRGCLCHAFQSELPIVYTGHGSSVLVVHPYIAREIDALLASANARIGADWHNAGMSFEDEIRRRLRSNLPRDVIVVTNCIDLTSVAASS